MSRRSLHLFGTFDDRVISAFPRKKRPRFVEVNAAFQVGAMAAYRHHSQFMQGSPFIRAGHIIQRARRQHTSALVVGAASVAVPRSEISIRSVTRTVTVMMTVVRSHSWMMSRLVTAGGLFFCDQLSRGRSVLGCSRCWDLGWSSLIVLRLRHRNCECYRGGKADSEYGRHLFHRFTYGPRRPQD